MGGAEAPRPLHEGVDLSGAGPQDVALPIGARRVRRRPQLSARKEKHLARARSGVLRSVWLSLGTW
jgi:hypothetical protein